MFHPIPLRDLLLLYGWLTCTVAVFMPWASFNGLPQPLGLPTNQWGWLYIAGLVVLAGSRIVDSIRARQGHVIIGLGFIGAGLVAIAFGWFGGAQLAYGFWIALVAAVWTGAVELGVASKTIGLIRRRGSTPLFCGRCGRQAQPNTQFCIGCGADLQARTTPATR